MVRAQSQHRVSSAEELEKAVADRTEGVLLSSILFCIMAGTGGFCYYWGWHLAQESVHSASDTYEMGASAGAAILFGWIALGLLFAVIYFTVRRMQVGMEMKRLKKN